MKKILYITLLIILLTGCNSSTKKEETKDEQRIAYTINYNYSEQFQISTSIDYTKKNIIVNLTNEESHNLKNTTVEAVFYDIDGNNIGKDSYTINDFIGKGEHVSTLNFPNSKTYDFIETDIFVTSKEEEENTSIQLFNNKIETSYKEIDDKIQVNIKNNSKTSLHMVEVALVFLKNNSPVHIENLRYSLEIDESISKSINIPKINKDKILDYDNIKIIVNQATSK